MCAPFSYWEALWTLMSMRSTRGLSKWWESENLGDDPRSEPFRLVRVKSTALAAIILRGSIREAGARTSPWHMNWAISHCRAMIRLAQFADLRILETGEMLPKSLSAKLMSLPPNCYSLANTPVHGSKASRRRWESSRLLLMKVTLHCRLLRGGTAIL